MRTRRLAVLIPLLLPALGVAGAQEPPPQTGFEQSNGASWTTHEEELGFLSKVDEMSERVEMSEIGETLQGRPMHLVRIGHPAPRPRESALAEPTTMFVCTQHGNEPAGREACLMFIRDMAFTSDPALIQQLATTTFLVIPTANPDGRDANSRTNSQGIDINRDHLNLRTIEARAIAAVVRDWKPDLAVDFHEYGPGVPVLYDDDVLYLWPRNLNVERQVHDLAQEFSLTGVKPCLTARGYTSDEYGLDAVGDIDVRQTAGNGDEGIMRNAMGLRHSLGILIETAVSQSTNPQQLPNEAGSTPAQQRRRVGSHRATMDCAMTWMRTRANTVKAATDTAPLRKQGEGMAQNVPTYFGGADNMAPAAADVVYPAPCAYRLTAGQEAQVRQAFALHGIQSFLQEDGSYLVPMGQPAEPLISLLLDARGDRRSVSASPVSAEPLSKACQLPQPEPQAHGGTMAVVVGLAAAGDGLRRRRRRR